MVFPPLLVRRKREGSYPFWLHRVRPRNGLVRASRRAVHLTNRPKHNGPVYARGSCDNLGQDIRSLCKSSDSPVGDQAVATTSFRLRQMESGSGLRATDAEPPSRPKAIGS